MNEETSKFNKIKLDITAQNLKKHFFNVEVFDKKEDALNFLKITIKQNDSIGYGGSKTLEEIGFFENFTPDKYSNIIDRQAKGLTFEQKTELQRKALTADVFLASPNAVSTSGELIFIDKNGNRVAAVTYGPKHTYLVAGINKIKTTYQEAIDRASNVAAVKNNIRFGTDNPCTVGGECFCCESDSCLCGVYTVIRKCFPTYTKTVMLINEELGF